jgi:hypothetical protein
MKEQAFTKTETFDEKQYQEKKELVDLKTESKRTQYAAKLRTGYDATPYVLHEVQYGKLGTQHIGAMKDELAAQHIQFQPKGGIRNLTKHLKTHLRNQWIIQNPSVDEKVYDEDEKKQSISAQSWKLTNSNMM